MAKIGYARVSTKDQNLDLQLAELEKAGCEKVYSEHKSGIKARLELAEAIKYLRKGDITSRVQIRPSRTFFKRLTKHHFRVARKRSIDTISQRQYRYVIHIWQINDAYLRKSCRI